LGDGDTVNSQRIPFLFYGLVVLIIVILVGLTWVNSFVTLHNPSADSFFIYWTGTRTLLKEGVSPYGEIATAIVQQFANLDFPETPKYALQVTYPLYAELFYLPFAFISDYTLARAVWLTFLEAALVTTVLVSLRTVGWRPGFILLGLVLIYELFGYHTISPLLSGSSIVLVTCLVGLAFAAVKAGTDELAGILLALSTIQPLAVAPLILFVLVWSGISSRWRLFVWLGGSLIVLIGSASLFMPDWVLQNARVIIHYPHTNLLDTPGAALVANFPGVGARLGWAFTILLSLVLLLEWWAARGKDTRWFLWTAGLTLTLSPWLGIPADPGNFVLLIIPSVLVFARLDEHWGRRVHPLIVMGMLVALVGFWAFFWGHIEDGLIPRQYPILFIPLPLITLIGLYWVKWWAVRPRKLLISDLRAEAGLD
jgi:hypothetical protein